MKIKYYLSKSKWQDLLVVSKDTNGQGTHITKVVEKPYGYLVDAFNHYITLYKHKIVLLDGGFVKVYTTMKKNYRGTQKWVTYYNKDGREIICFQDYDKEVSVFNHLVKGNLDKLELSESVY